MKYNIYYLNETDEIYEWKALGIFGKSENDEGKIFFPKIIRTMKNDIFPFWPEIYVGNYRFNHQNGSQIFIENWTRKLSRDIDDNFPMTFTNDMKALRILQI